MHALARREVGEERFGAWLVAAALAAAVIAVAGYQAVLLAARSDHPRALIGPTMLGDCIHHPLRGGSMVVRGSSWLAAGDGIDIDSSWRGFTSAVFSGEGLVCQFSGQGRLWVQTRYVSPFLGWVHPFRPVKSK